MGIFGGQMAQQALPPAAPPPLPVIPPPEPVPTSVDPQVKQARDDAKKRAAAMSGYASTIATGGQGIVGPASTTASAGGKVLLGA